MSPTAPARTSLPVAANPGAGIDFELFLDCIHCGLCYIACEDGAHQSFDWQEVDGKRYPHVMEEECVGCNLCYLICPSPGAITMKRVDAGGPSQSWRERTAQTT